MTNIERIATHYGKDKQISKAIEELCECLTELAKFQNGKGEILNVIDEIADTKIMLEQVVFLLGISDDVEIREQEKINRQLKRIEAEKPEYHFGNDMTVNKAILTLKAICTAQAENCDFCPFTECRKGQMKAPIMWEIRE